jgi:hypothetical protein
LEEMDILFGSVGIAEREKERWKEVHAEVGLTDILARSGAVELSAADSGNGAHEKEVAVENEKAPVTETADPPKA